MLSPAELAAALDGDDENDETDDGTTTMNTGVQHLFERTFTGNTSASVASRISRLTGVGEYFEMTLTEFDTRIVLLEPLGQGASGVARRGAGQSRAQGRRCKLLHQAGSPTRPQLVEFRRDRHPPKFGPPADRNPARASRRRDVHRQEFVDGGSLHEVLHSSSTTPAGTATSAARRRGSDARPGRRCRRYRPGRN